MENRLNEVKVLVVDDSPFMRKAIERILESMEGVRVMALARNGLEALDFIQRERPDVITLDVEMPKMNGLETLKIIMKDPNPIPCIMVSSHTTEGAEITLTALDEGAIDFITKPSSLMGRDLSDLKIELREKLIVASSMRKVVPRLVAEPELVTPVQMPAKRKRDVDLVLIGISTGGPPALQKLIPQLPVNFPVAIAIVQHMPPGFTKSMAKRLNKNSALEVKEAEEGDLVTPGRVLVARSGMHLQFSEKHGKKVVALQPRLLNDHYSPSVNTMFESASNVFREKSLPVIMTGMGEDGTKGLHLLKRYNVFSMAQSRESSVVYGMPKSAIDAGLIDRVVDLNDMPKAIVEEI